MGISGSGDLKMNSCGEGSIVAVGGIGRFASLLQSEGRMYSYMCVRSLWVKSRVVETATATSHVYNWKSLSSLFR